jgi:hypothetical protein
MPRRGRYDKRAKRLELSPVTSLALTIGPTPTTPGAPPVWADEYLLALWTEHRDKLMASSPPGSAPWGYWYFEPGIPEPLREHRPELVEVLDDEDAEAAARDSRREAADELDRCRAAWLSEHGIAAAVAP